MLWMLCVVAAVVVGRALWQARRRRASAVWRGGAGLCVGLAAACVALAPAWILLQKVIAKLLMPAGLVGVGLVALTAMAFQRRQHRAITCAVLAAYLAASNEWVAARMMARLERDYAGIDPFASGSFDAVFVLGGGTSVTPLGGAQLGGSGDRVALAAQLYHAGVTRTLVTSGHSIAGLEQERDYSEDTALIWRRLGVPAQAIVRLGGPRNTAEEAAAYAGLIRERGWRRVGLVTSGSHMRRALRQARRQGLEFTPLPADLKGRPSPPSAVVLLPQAHALDDVQRAAWELLGGVLAR